MIYYLGVADNNRASTVLKLFVSAAQMYGLPSRVRYNCFIIRYPLLMHSLLPLQFVPHCVFVFIIDRIRDAKIRVWPNSCYNTVVL